jgi:hypothetical protein
MALTPCHYATIPSRHFGTARFEICAPATTSPPGWPPLRSSFRQKHSLVPDIQFDQNSACQFCVKNYELHQFYLLEWRGETTLER